MKKNSFRLLAVTLVIFFMAGAVTSAQAGTDIPRIGERAYWDLVQRSRDEVEKLKDASAENIRAGLSQLADEWKSITEVKMEDERIVPVNNQYLLNHLLVSKPDTHEIIKILDALLAAHAEYPDKLFSTADLDSLHTILSRPEFLWAAAATNPIDDWFQKIWDWFWRWQDSIFGGKRISIPVFPYIAAILLAVVLFFAFRTLFVDFASEARIKLDDEDEDNEPLTSDAAFDKAQALSRGGDYRSAVRYLYLSSLLLLDERDVLRYDRSKTNREYLRSVANSPELSEPLREVIEVFDDVWYGYHTLEDESFQHYSKRVEELKAKKQ